MKTASETEVLVIGAGAVGCAIAYYLTKRGASVIVVDAAAVGAGTSSATLGLVWVQSKEPGPYMELNLTGARMHAELAAEFEEDVELRQPGGLILCPDEEVMRKELAAMQRLTAESSSYEAHVLSAAEVCELEPFVAGNIAGGIYSPHDGHINPYKLISNLVRLSKRRDARFLLHTPVRRILPNGNQAIGVETSDDVIWAKHVVVAAGNETPALVRPLGINLPLDMVRGQLLVTERLRQRVLFHPLSGLEHLRQTVAGNILIGKTHEHVGMDNSATVEAAKQIARNALSLVPALSDTLIIRQFAGIRPVPADGMPYLGPVHSVPNLYIAVSHSGITLAPVHGKVISDLILDGETDVPIECYQPERFTDVQSGTEH